MSVGDVTTIAGNGDPSGADGVGIAASIAYPRGLHIDSMGYIYVAEESSRIRIITTAGNLLVLLLDRVCVNIFCGF